MQGLDLPTHRVLDHGFVRLVDYMGTDISIVRSARVSYDAAWRAGENEGSDNRLIRYLLRNGHNTPFEAVVATLEIKAPIFVVRQWHRHRTQSYNELSARYRELPEEFYVPEPHLLGKQSSDNKQVRVLEPDIKDAELRCMQIRISCEQSFAEYRALLQDGVPREIARTVLPLATYTHMFSTANLHNWLRFLSERLHPHAQYEIRLYAEAVRKLLNEIVPVTMRAFEETLDI